MCFLEFDSPIREKNVEVREVQHMHLHKPRLIFPATQAQSGGLFDWSLVRAPGTDPRVSTNNPI